MHDTEWWHQHHPIHTFNTYFLNPSPHLDGDSIPEPGILHCYCHLSFYSLPQGCSLYRVASCNFTLFHAPLLLVYSLPCLTLHLPKYHCFTFAYVVGLLWSLKLLIILFPSLGQQKHSQGHIFDTRLIIDYPGLQVPLLPTILRSPAWNGLCRWVPAPIL